MNFERLRELERGLRGLAAEDPEWIRGRIGFGMNHWMKWVVDGETHVLAQPWWIRTKAEDHEHSCGTAACAGGWAAIWGIGQPQNYEFFDEYLRQTFDLSRREATWVFGGDWSQVDDTALGAADRIAYLIERGVPLDMHSQMYDRARLSYRSREDES